MGERAAIFVFFLDLQGKEKFICQVWLLQNLKLSTIKNVMLLILRAKKKKESSV